MKFNLNLKWTAAGRKAAAVLCSLLFLMLALTLSGCTGKAEKPAMVVNDVAVPQGVLNYYINYGKDYLASYGIDINDPETGAQYMSLIEEWCALWPRKPGFPLHRSRLRKICKRKKATSPTTPLGRNG